MTLQDENALLTQTGPGTPMGDLMRRYWIPAALSKEVTPDGVPVRLLLLGEKLIAFRDTAGRVGILDHRCPHRCASLFFGRNEENGLRCVYHGWKYDVEGHCLDQANLPERQQFMDRVRAKAYRVAERNGLIWVYMGKAEEAPELPPFESALLPEAETEYRFVQRECNWLQAIEGDFDTSHLGFLHFGSGASNVAAAGDARRNLLRNRAPEYKVGETEFGVTYAAYRPAENNGTYWRFAHYLFPFWVMPPISPIQLNVMVRAWVPMDDTHVMFVSIAHKNYMEYERADMPGTSLIDRLKPNTTDWHGRYRLIESRENDYEIDREVQCSQSYTGIEGIHVQDQMITESMGGIVDRAWENLAASDIMVARTRRKLLQTLAVLQQGVAPPAAATPGVYAGVRGGSFVSKDEGDWLQLYRDKARSVQAKGAGRPVLEVAL